MNQNYVTELVIETSWPVLAYCPFPITLSEAVELAQPGSPYRGELGCILHPGSQLQTRVRSHLSPARQKLTEADWGQIFSYLFLLLLLFHQVSSSSKTQCPSLDFPLPTIPVLNTSPRLGPCSPRASNFGMVPWLLFSLLSPNRVRHGLTRKKVYYCSHLLVSHHTWANVMQWSYSYKWHLRVSDQFYWILFNDKSHLLSHML